MKSIALVYLPNKEKLDYGSGVIRARVPYPLIHLGSYLKNKGIKVFLIDGQVCDAKKELEKIMEKVDVIGFSVMTMQLSNSLKLTDYIKKKYPEKEIIWGGIHPSLLPEQTIKDKSIDYVCQREGEHCLYDLCKGKPLNKIKNLVYQKDEKIIVNPIGDFIDLDKEDKPIWDMLNLENYIKRHKFGPKKDRRAFGISVGRGCIWNCTYCVNTVLGRKWRSLSAENIIKRIKFLRENYDIQHFTIVDDCFELNMERVKEFCNVLIKENINITWEVNVRAGQKWTDEIMDLFAKSGCILLGIGAESGSDRILKLVYRKGITTKDILFTAHQCRKYKIPLGTGWMGGVPSETEEELNQTLKLIKKVVKICPNAIISGPAPFRPYPNSALYFEAVKQGYRQPQSLREWAEKSTEGYLAEEAIPWVKDPNKLKAIEFYCVNAYRYPINTLHKVLILLCKFRLRYNIYALPFERPLTKYYVQNIYRD
jgi:radical SAM superfamily enzyme YgiQ (UPF0313 family)|tara:strand:+ start:2372 stop:3814 length:1443 start_codon:yes stop_codon:yes gene_type:complete